MNIELDETTGDWKIENGKVQFVSGQDEIKQILKVKFQTFLGEWFLDTRKGVAWFSKVFKKNANPAEIEALIIETIVTSPGITGIISLELEVIRETRQLKVTFEATTIDGNINFSEVVP